MTNYYSIDDGNGHQITTGLAPHIARKTAQQIADERGESVWLYDSQERDSAGDVPSLEIRPSLTADTITEAQVEALRAEAAAAGDTMQVAYCELAWSGNPDRDPHVRRARGICASAINAARAQEGS